MAGRQGNWSDSWVAGLSKFEWMNGKETHWMAG